MVALQVCFPPIEGAGLGREVAFESVGPGNNKEPPMLMATIVILKQALGLGLPAAQITFVQISLRAIIVFIVTVAMVRVGNRRFLSKMTAFDAVLGFLLASVLARAVNGTAAFFPTLGAG